MRRLPFAAVLIASIGAAASDAAQRPADSGALALARAEWQAAQLETRRLEEAAARASDDASKLALQRQAAASAIAAAEAQVSAASAEFAVRRQAVAEARQRLAEKQQPVAALIAGLVNLERRPPQFSLSGFQMVLIRLCASVAALGVEK